MVVPSNHPVPRESGLPNPAGQRALVLGDRGIADRIVESLAGLGIVAERSLAPATIDELRGLLDRFAKKGRAEAGNPGLPLFLHPGTTAWAERPEPIAIGQTIGLHVISPPARALAHFSNKLNLLAEADRLGIPNVVLSFEPVQSPREIEKLMAQPAGPDKWSFPFVLKATRSGAGFGRYVVREPGDLEQKLALWLDQLRLHSPEAMLFAERYVEGARYVTSPFARFGDDRFEAFPLCDSSLQSRYRKVIEFCPAESLEPAVETQLRAWSAMLARAVGFVGVGAFEFLVDGPRAYLVEGLGRLNTNFHLWESVAGINAVAWQLAALSGREPPRSAPELEWAAGIAFRFHAEDSLLQLPQPGRIYELGDEREWSFPGAAVELDLARSEGEIVDPRDSSLIGFLWVGGRDAAHALTVARGVLDEIWIAGSLTTNERFLSELINHPWVKSGVFHAGFVEEEFLPAIRPPVEVLSALASLAVQAADPSPARWAVGDQWAKPAALDWVAGPHRFEVSGLRGVSGTIRLKDGRSMRTCAYPIAPDKWQARVSHWTMVVRRVTSAAASTTRGASSASGKGKPRIAALISGRVHSVLFREGSVVPAHEAFLVIESLGMLVPHALPRDVRVVKWKVQAEDQVRVGEELADFELTHPS